MLSINRADFGRLDSREASDRWLDCPVSELLTLLTFICVFTLWVSPRNTCWIFSILWCNNLRLHHFGRMIHQLAIIPNLIIRVNVEFFEAEPFVVWVPFRFEAHLHLCGSPFSCKERPRAISCWARLACIFQIVLVPQETQPVILKMINSCIWLLQFVGASWDCLKRGPWWKEQQIKVYLGTCWNRMVLIWEKRGH